MYGKIEYPLRLCVEMLHYCFWSNEKTQAKKVSEIKTMLLGVFTEEEISKAQKILSEWELKDYSKRYSHYER